jgi:hypothetical protein
MSNKDRFVQQAVGLAPKATLWWQAVHREGCRLRADARAEVGGRELLAKRRSPQSWLALQLEPHPDLRAPCQFMRIRLFTGHRRDTRKRLLTLHPRDLLLICSLAFTMRNSDFT